MSFIVKLYSSDGSISKIIKAEEAVEFYTSAVIDSPFIIICLLYTSPSPRDATLSRMPSSA